MSLKRRLLCGLGVLGILASAYVYADISTLANRNLEQLTLTGGVLSSNIAKINGITPLMGNGVTGTGSQRVTIASDNTPFPVKVDQTTPGTTNAISVAQVGATTVASGNGVTGAGSQRVTVASDNTPFPVKVDQTTPGTTNAVSVAQIGATTVATGNGVTGTGSQRVTVASDNTPFPVKTDQTTHGTTDLVASDLTKIGGAAVVVGNGVTGTGSQRVTVASDNTAFSVNTIAAPAVAPCKTVTINAQGAAGADVTVDATAGGVTVLAASATRCAALIKNTGSAQMRCGPTSQTITATVYGVVIDVAQSYSATLAMQQAWKCIRTGGSSTTANIVEETT